MNFQKKIDLLRNQALDLIQRSQNDRGSFATLSWNPRHPASQTTYTTTFATSLIVLCLKNIAGSQSIKEKAVNFLLSEKSDLWTFNYWSRTCPAYTKKPYPDDWDDTACALAALYQEKPSLFDTKVLALITSVLTSTERSPGGPYKTWMVDRNASEKWQDYDIAVNANISFFLSKLGISLRNTTQFIESSLSKPPHSPYYPTASPLFYYISRGLTISSSATFQNLIRKEGKRTNLNQLDCALCITSMLRIGLALDEVAPLMVQLIDSSDSIQAYPFCFDPAINHQPYVAGSPSLTAAFIAEACSVFQEFQKKENKPIHTQKPALAHQVKAAVLQESSLLPSQLAKAISQWIKTMDEKDSDGQIFALPELAGKGLRLSAPNRHNLLLGKTTVYGWITYTIADNFLDQEAHIPDLPVAQWTLRQLQKCLIEITDISPEFGRYCQKVLNQIDAANYWEVTMARCQPIRTSFLLEKIILPDYGTYRQLAERSFGHAIAPLGLLAFSGKHPSSVEFKAIESFFKHYLIGRQLNDDAHDWKNDLQAGQLNAVVCLILEDWRATHKGKRVTLSQLEHHFWKHTLFHVSNRLLKEVAAARRALSRYPGEINQSFFESLLKPIEKSAQQALQSKQDGDAFLAAYYSVSER